MKDKQLTFLSTTKLNILLAVSMVLSISALTITLLSLTPQSTVLSKAGVNAKNVQALETLLNMSPMDVSQLTTLTPHGFDIFLNIHKSTDSLQNSDYTPVTTVSPSFNLLAKASENSYLIAHNSLLNTKGILSNPIFVYEGVKKSLSPDTTKIGYIPMKKGNRSLITWRNNL